MSEPIAQTGGISPWRFALRLVFGRRRFSISYTSSIPPWRPPWRFVLRLVWVVVQLSFVYWQGESGVQFIYQGF